MRKILFEFLFLIIFVSEICSAADLNRELGAAENNYNSCMREISVKSRWMMQKGTKKTVQSLQQRQMASACLKKREQLENIRTAIQLRQSLLSIQPENKMKPKMIVDEASLIAQTLVNETVKLNEKYKMGSFSLWHNFLIKLHLKNGGYCYQWTDELLKSLSGHSFGYFDVFPGVHNRGQLTENNGIIITAKGEPISSGIIYDPWRGGGKPYWLFIRDDSQDWSQL